MSEVRVDSEKNRLIIMVAGVLNRENIEKIKVAVSEQIGQLQPGFGVITDMSQVGFGYLSGRPALKELMNILVENQVGTVVRVGMSGCVLLKQISSITKRLGSYEPVYVSSVEEAEAVLDGES